MTVADNTVLVSVTTVGRSQEATDPRDIVRLRGSGPWTLAPGRLGHFIRVTPGIVHGRRLTTIAALPAAVSTATVTT